MTTETKLTFADFDYRHEMDTTAVYRAEVASVGNRYRATLETLNGWEYQPDGDDALVLRAPDSWDSTACAVQTPHSMSHHADELGHALSFFVQQHGHRAGLEIFERYLRIFHGGACKVITGPELEGTYVSVATDTLREYWGVKDFTTEDLAECPDWQAYADGDVYGVSVERWDAEREDWTPAGESADGRIVVYGDEWAAQTATEEINALIAEDIEDMLPIFA